MRVVQDRLDKEKVVGCAEMSEVRVVNPSVRRGGLQIESSPRDVEAQKEARKKGQWDHTVDAIQQLALSDDQFTIVEYQVADSPAAGLGHSGHFRLFSDRKSTRLGDRKSTRLNSS